MTRSKRPSDRLNLSDLKPDPQNANRGTDRGREALARSLREYGAGRAVLIDRRSRVIAGNKTVEQARALNLPLHVVETDGTFLIAVQRNDLDLRTDARAKALAIADNRVGELDLEWDVEMLKQLRADGLDLSGRRARAYGYRPRRSVCARPASPAVRRFDVRRRRPAALGRRRAGADGHRSPVRRAVRPRVAAPREPQSADRRRPRDER
jgi:hypothetical protein